MLRIAVVDDESKEREQIKKYVEQYFSDRGKEVALHLYEDGASLIQDAPKNLDILFLDIQMEEVDGIRAARAIRQYDEEVLIIFITNMVQYAIEGYSVNALDFVLKPVDQEAINRELDKAFKRMQKKSTPLVTMRSTDGTFVLDTKEILYIETYERKLLVHTTKGDISCNDTL